MKKNATTEKNRDILPFPLSWPDGWQRREVRRRATFGFKERTAVYNDLLKILCRLRSGHIILSSNLPIDQECWPDFSAQVEDPAVAVYFNISNTQYVLACDSWDRWADNLFAVISTLEKIERVTETGVENLMGRLLTGFTIQTDNHEQENHLPDHEL